MRRPRRLRRICRELWNDFVHEPWYWLKCAVWHRFNVIYIQSLDPRWHDRNEVLLHANFQILKDFVEREDPFHHFNIEASSHNREQWEEIRRLYCWWTIERPARIDPWVEYQKKPTHSKGAIAQQTEAEFNAEDNRNLVRLIAVRKHLWT